MIPAYFVADISAGYELPLSYHPERSEGSVKFSIHVNNLFNNMYYADAWVWRAYFLDTDSWYSEAGVFPQAPANFMMKVSLAF